jgi:hypothetical protein
MILCQPLVVQIPLDSLRNAVTYQHIPQKDERTYIIVYATPGSSTLWKLA